jgi:CheY-like chemotaxis protein
MTSSADYSIGTKKVLVIANPELASVVYDGLESYILPPAVRERASLREAIENKSRTVSWLCEQVFPSPKETPKVGALNRAWRAFWDRESKPLAAGSADSDVASADSTMSLFQWGAYDYVIIQDVWRSDVGPDETLEAAGFVLANLDYYLWGNFSTKKIILVTTEKNFLRQKIERGSWRTQLSLPSDAPADLSSVFDVKQAFELVEVNEPGADPIKQIRDLLMADARGVDSMAKVSANENQVHQQLKQEQTAAISGVLTYPVMQQALKVLRTYILHHAEVIVVDDELRELDETVSQLTGKRLRAIGQQDPGRVAVATASSESVEQANDFEQLIRICAKQFDTAARTGKQYMLLVTDILFRGPAWHQTGLDLIERLRDELQVQSMRRVGIVAYTAFTTPFIATSSYQRGADFVVSKTGLGGHDLNVSGKDRLMMTLAFLCFQKSFLSEQRSRAGELIMSTRARTSEIKEESFERLRQLQRILPKHAVSMHLHQEWLDTCYLLEAINVYGDENDQLGGLYDEINGKYE